MSADATIMHKIEFTPCRITLRQGQNKLAVRLMMQTGYMLEFDTVVFIICS